MSAPPILPLYKTQSKSTFVSKEGRKGCGYYLIMVGLIVLPILLIVLFFFSIFLGSSYLQSHILEDQNGSSNVVNRIGIGLPNTRNIIKKWSISHLNGIDITALGPPVYKAPAFNNTA